MHLKLVHKEEDSRLRFRSQSGSKSLFECAAWVIERISAISDSKVDNTLWICVQTARRTSIGKFCFGLPYSVRHSSMLNQLTQYMTVMLALIYARDVAESKEQILYVRCNQPKITSVSLWQPQNPTRSLRPRFIHDCWYRSVDLHLIAV